MVSRHATLLSFVEYDPRERRSRCYYLGAEERKQDGRESETGHELKFPLSEMTVKSSFC